MNAAQYGPGQYDHHSQYGNVTNYRAPVQHGSILLTGPGYPHFPPLPAQAGHHYAGSNPQFFMHTSGPGIPQNAFD